MQAGPTQPCRGRSRFHPRVLADPRPRQSRHPNPATSAISSSQAQFIGITVSSTSLPVTFGPISPAATSSTIFASWLSTYLMPIIHSHPATIVHTATLSSSPSPTTTTTPLIISTATSPMAPSNHPVVPSPNPSIHSHTPPPDPPTHSHFSLLTDFLITWLTILA